jgi:hypothetical protein
MEPLTEENFLLYAARHYDNPQCHSTEEFLEDVNRVKYVKKLITRYRDTGDLKDRLIMNHMIVLSNVFAPTHLNRILWLRARQYFPCIKPFLVALSVCQDRIYEVDGHDVINIVDVPMDTVIVEALRKT